MSVGARFYPVHLGHSFILSSTFLCCLKNVFPNSNLAINTIITFLAQSNSKAEEDLFLNLRNSNTNKASIVNN